MSRIGMATKLKQNDKGPYVTLGIAKTTEGYEIRKITLRGLEIEATKVLHKCDDRAEAMQQMQIALSHYIVNFNNREMG